jgi:hypothetical protein
VRATNQYSGPKPNIDWFTAPGGEDQPLVFPMGIGFRVMGHYPSGKRPCVRVWLEADGFWHLEKAQWTRESVTATYDLSGNWSIREPDGCFRWSTPEEAILVAMAWLVARDAEIRLGGGL